MKWVLLSIAALVVSLFLAGNMYAVAGEQVESMSTIMVKIAELKTLEKTVDKKLKELESERKTLESEREKLEREKSEVEKEVAQQKQVLESLKKNIAAEKIKKLADIYANASPDAAAQELSNMDPCLAAEILTFMRPRAAGAIVSAMNPKKASKIFQLYLKDKRGR